MPPGGHGGNRLSKFSKCIQRKHLFVEPDLWIRNARGYETFLVQTCRSCFRSGWDLVHTINRTETTSSKRSRCGCFGLYPSPITVLNLYKQNTKKWENKPEFDLNWLNTTDVKTPLRFLKDCLFLLLSASNLTAGLCFISKIIIKQRTFKHLLI